MTVGPRHSLIQPKANPNATNPANAILNYLYARLDSETKRSLLAADLDLAAAITHSDEQFRDSFIQDVMDAVRPKVDAWWKLHQLQRK